MSTNGITTHHATAAWTVAFVVTAVGAFGLTPWDAIDQLIAEQGIGDTQAQMLGFVGGYTLPATVATALLVWCGLNRHLDSMSGPPLFILVGTVYLGSAALSASWGLFTLPGVEDQIRYEGGPPYVALPLLALRVYLNAYGVGLTASAIAIGSAAAVQVCAWQGSLALARRADA
jgi:hypothetical protein